MGVKDIAAYEIPYFPLDCVGFFQECAAVQRMLKIGKSRKILTKHQIRHDKAPSFSTV